MVVRNQTDFFVKLAGFLSMHSTPRLIAAELLYYEWAAALRCKNFLNPLKESRERHLTFSFLCAVAQHVIYAAPNAYYYCKTRVELGCVGIQDHAVAGVQL